MPINLIENEGNQVDETIKSKVKIANDYNGLEVSLNFTEEQFEGHMMILDTGNSVIESIKEKGVYYQEKSIRINKINYYADKYLGMIKSVVDSAPPPLFTFNVLLLVTNPVIGILFLRMMQTFAIYRFINIQLPANIATLFSFFDKSLLELIPNVVEFEKTGMGCKSHPRIIEGNHDCLIINNGGSTYLIQILVYGFLKMVAVLGVKSGRENAQAALYKYSLKLNKKLNSSFFFKHFQAVQLALLTRLMINLHFLLKSPFLVLINAAVSLFVLLIHYAFSFACIRYSFKLQSFSSLKKPMMRKGNPFGVKDAQKRSLEENGDKATSIWIFLREEVSDDTTGLGRHFILFFLLKDLITTGAILKFIRLSVEVQILFPLIYNIFITVLLTVYKPLKVKHMNWLNLFSVGSEVLVLLVFGVLYICIHKPEKFKYETVGSTMVILMGLIFLGYIVIGIYFAVKKIASFFSKKDRKEIEKAKNTSQVTPERVAEQRRAKEDKGMSSLNVRNYELYFFLELVKREV